MSFAIFKQARVLTLAACISSLVAFGACDSSPRTGTGPAAVWYEGSAPIIRHQVDVSRNRLWILAWDGVHVYDQGTRKQIGRAALPEWSWVGEPYGCAPALAIGPQGEAIVTSDVAPAVWRVDPVNFAVTRTVLALDADADKDAGFSGLAYAPAQGVFIATSTFTGTLWRVDPLLQTAQKIALSSRLPRTCGWDIAPPAPGRGRDLRLQLCISSRRLSRQISVTPDLRSADVVAQTCGRSD